MKAVKSLRTEKPGLRKNVVFDTPIVIHKGSNGYAAKQIWITVEF